MGDAAHAQHFIAQPQQGAAAHAGAAQMAAGVTLHLYKSGAGAHADHHGPVAARDEPPSLADGLELIHLAGRDPINISLEKGRPYASEHHLADVLDIQFVFG